jgi:hypothetical protein
MGVYALFVYLLNSVGHSYIEGLLFCPHSEYTYYKQTMYWGYKNEVEMGYCHPYVCSCLLFSATWHDETSAFNYYNSGFVHCNLCYYGQYEQSEKV